MKQEKLLSIILAVSLIFNLFTVTSVTQVKAFVSENWNYEIINDDVIITGYHGEQKNVTIPVTIAGKNVIAIGDRTFSSCSNLESITIPNGVTSIGSYAFSDCSNLKDIKISDSVTTIGECAFIFCSSLENIVLPRNVKSIEYKEHFGYSCFYGCSSLKNIYVDAENQNFSSLQGILYNKNQSVLLAFPSGSEMSKIEIPDSVIYIMRYAFLDCENITDITIPDNIEYISSDIFKGCKNLVNINTYDSNRFFCSMNGVLYNKDKTKLLMYPIGKGDGDFIIPDSVTIIEENAFSFSSELKNIIISKNVLKIEERAFFGCRNLVNAKFMGEKPEGLNKDTFGYINDNFKLFYPKENEASWLSYNDYAKQSYGEKKVIISDIQILKKDITVSKGKTYQLEYILVPSDADSKEIIWSSSNPKIASVTQKGMVKAVGKGKCTIIAVTSDGKKIAKCKITVKVPVKKIKLNKKKISIKKGKKYVLKAKVLPTDATNKKVTWSSSNKKVATVSKGKVRGRKRGTCYIIVKTKGGRKKAKCKVTVK